jgi:hypothetical protein
MDATRVREQVTDELLEKLEQSHFVHVPLMDRIEGRLRTQDELERYAEILVRKLKDTDFRSVTLFDRVDRIVGLLEHPGDGPIDRDVRLSPASSFARRVESR